MNTFILIVLGQIISLFGNAALRFALPLYLLRQTGSAALYGGITALAMLPALVGMLTGGALADRCRKVRLMALLDLVTAGIAAAAAAGLPHLPLLPLVLTVLGSLYAMQGLYQPCSTRLSAPAAERHPAAARQRSHPTGGYRGRASRSPAGCCSAGAPRHPGSAGALRLLLCTFCRDGALSAHPTGRPL